MNIQDYITMMTKQARAKSFSDSAQLSLGQLISEVERCGIMKNDNEEKWVYFDFGSAVPTTLDSWRGSYSELALGYALTGYDAKNHDMDAPKAGEFLTMLKDSIGKEYEGWKGGEFIMDESTPVWVANPGNSGSTAIIGVLDDGYRLVLLTAYNEY